MQPRIARWTAAGLLATALSGCGNQPDIFAEYPTLIGADVKVLIAPENKHDVPFGREIPWSAYAEGLQTGKFNLPPDSSVALLNGTRIGTYGRVRAFGGTLPGDAGNPGTNDVTVTTYAGPFTASQTSSFTRK